MSVTYQHISNYLSLGQLYVPIVFRWEGGGHQVWVCTSFHGWEANKIQLTRSQGISYSHSTSADPDADFTAVVELPEGIHEYKYIVDGEWQHDPDKETCPNIFHTLNNVHRVTKKDFDAYYRSSQQLYSQPPPSQPATKQPPPPKPATKQPPPSQPATKQPPPSQPATKQPPPSQPATKQPPPSKPATKQPPPSQPATKQPPPSQPATKQPPPSQPATKQPPASKTATKQPSPTTKQPPHQTSAHVVQVSVGGTTITEEAVGHGTVHPAANFDPEADAAALKKAMKKLGTDEKTIIEILAHRSNDQRQQIGSKFNTKYGKDLVSELKSELSFNFKHAILALMVPTRLYDAQCLHKAMKGAGTNEKCLIEILTSRTNAEIHGIKQVYKAEFGLDLEKDVAADTSGHFKRLMVSLCQGAREERTPVDAVKALKEAQALYDSGAKKWGTDESNFIHILGVRSFPQLRLTFDKYLEISKHDIHDAIEREMSGDLSEAMKAIVECARSRHDFFADRLYKSMKGAGTDDATLIRIIVSRSEVDLVEIKEAFLERHKKTLRKFIEGDTSGDYRKLLVAIVGNHD